jgi:glutamine synthetase
MPALPRDTTDRNRTSPIAYTGNKLEFRAIGASQNSSGANVALNTIMAWALDSICTDLEKSICSGEEFNASLSKILSAEVKAHRRILFDGDCYSTAWKREAAERGLSNFTTTPKALEILKCKKVVELFTKYNVLSVRELNSRYEIYSETYRKTIALEAECALRIIRTMIIPSGLTYLSDLAVAKTHLKATGLSRLAKRISQLIEILLVSAEKIEAALQTCNCQKIRAFMSEARLASDELENLVPKDLWPMPTYSEMLFII